MNKYLESNARMLFLLPSKPPSGGDRGDYVHVCRKLLSLSKADEIL